MTAATVSAHQLGAALDLELVDVDSPLWPIVAAEAAHRQLGNRPPAPPLGGPLVDAVRVLLRPTHVIVVSEYSADRVAVSTLYAADGAFVAFQQSTEGQYLVDGPHPASELGSQLAAGLSGRGSPFAAAVPWASYIVLSAWMDAYRTSWGLADADPSVARIPSADVDAAIEGSDQWLALGFATLAGMDGEAVRLVDDPAYRTWARERLTSTGILRAEPEGLALGAAAGGLGAMAVPVRFWSVAVTRSDGSWGRVINLAAGDELVMVVADANPAVEPYAVLSCPSPADLPGHMERLAFAEETLVQRFPGVASQLAGARAMRACGRCRAGVTEDATCAICGWSPTEDDSWVTVASPTTCETADDPLELWPGVPYHLNEKRPGWALVEAADGRSGWVAVELLRSLESQSRP